MANESSRIERQDNVAYTLPNRGDIPRPEDFSNTPEFLPHDVMVVCLFRSARAGVVVVGVWLAIRIHRRRAQSIQCTAIPDPATPLLTSRLTPIASEYTLVGARCETWDSLRALGTDSPVPCAHPGPSNSL
jgi:hypothetical protein